RALEVVVHERGIDLRLAGDAADRRLVESLLREDPPGGGQDLPPGVDRARPAPGTPSLLSHAIRRNVTGLSHAPGAEVARCSRAKASASARSSMRAVRLGARRVLTSNTTSPS